MTLPWPEGATCGRCRWWGYGTEGEVLAHCWAARHDAEPRGLKVDAADVELITYRDHGCRAWKPRAEKAGP